MQMKGLAVEKGRAEEVRKALLEKGKLVKGLKPLREGGRIVFPITSSISGQGEELEREFEKRPFLRGVNIKIPLDFIGDIAVVKDMLSKEELGSLLSKPNVRTVLLNRGIKGGHRVMGLEWLGGDVKYDTFHRENGLTFYIDLRKAYFNPRLSTERARVTDLVKDGEAVIDMFSGIGPFSLNIASKKKALIYAVDKNPWAVKLMKRNIELNSKRLAGEIIPINEDAMDVKLKGDRVIMNLPFHSLDFLDAALSFLEGKGHIHLYSIFERGEEKQTIRKIEEKTEKFKCELVKGKDYSATKVIGFFDLEG